MNQFEHLLVGTDAFGVCTVTLNRPERLNAVNPVLAQELPIAIATAAAQDSVRVVVITGGGRAFCAGLDLSEPINTDRGSLSERLDPYLWVGRWVKSVTECAKPVIAAINGVAAGAGFGLALACDIRLISASAKCTAGYVRRGLSPDAGLSWFLPRLVGYSRAMEIVLTGRDVSANEAMSIGLVAELYAESEFAVGVADYVGRLAAGPPVAFALTKRLMLASAAATLDTQLREELTHIRTCFATKDVQEAIAAFGEKRAPVFQGK